MNPELKELFKSEFHISTQTTPADCKLWHSLGLHICPDGISIFNVDVDKIAQYGQIPPCVETLKSVLKSMDFKRVKNENKWTISSNMENYNKALKIIENFDKKMDPETKKMRYE